MQVRLAQVGLQGQACSAGQGLASRLGGKASGLCSEGQAVLYSRVQACSAGWVEGIQARTSDGTASELQGTATLQQTNTSVKN